MRLIDADKLLEWRHTFASDFGRTCAEMFISAIDQEETIEIPNKWIPVSERLPEKNVEVLVTTDLGYITIAEWFEYDHWFICEGSYNAHTDELIAWMPLPEPYKESEER